MELTYEEQQLISIYNSTGTRAGVIDELTAMRQELGQEDAELIALTDAALEKLTGMTDENFAALDLVPDFSEEDEDAG